jgi:hypothetical protein
MLDLLQPMHLIVLGFIFCIILIPSIFYLLTLQNALAKCAPVSRTMDPTMVWLLLIPLVNLIWGFFVVIALAKSIGNEFRRRGIPCPDPMPGQTIGMAKCICACFGIIPVIRFVTGPAAFVLWIIYWVKIAEFSRLLDIPVGVPYSPPPVV